MVELDDGRQRIQELGAVLGYLPAQKDTRELSLAPSCHFTLGCWFSGGSVSNGFQKTV